MSVVDVRNKKSVKKITFDIEVFWRKILERLFFISEFCIINSVIYVQANDSFFEIQISGPCCLK